MQIVEISQAQMAALCGNVLELENGDGLPVLAMSSQASLFHPVPLCHPPPPPPPSLAALIRQYWRSLPIASMHGEQRGVPNQTVHQVAGR